MKVLAALVMLGVLGKTFGQLFGLSNDVEVQVVNCVPYSEFRVYGGYHACVCVSGYYLDPHRKQCALLAQQGPSPYYEDCGSDEVYVLYGGEPVCVCREGMYRDVDSQACLHDDDDDDDR